MINIKIDYRKLIAACIVHLCVGSVYAWSTLVIPIQEYTGWSKGYITFAFSIIILFLSIAAFLARETNRRFGLAKSCTIASILFGLSYIGLGLAVALKSLPLLYIFSITAGLGIGTCYILPVDAIMQWFPNRKGLSGGACIMAFGFGSAIASPCFNSLSETSPILALMVVGLLYMVIMIPAAMYLSLPKKYGRTYNLGIVYYDKSKFIKLFLAFYINIACGISLLALISPIVQNLGATEMFATMVVSIIGIANGGGRIFWAGISDEIGRDKTYQIFFLSEAVLFTLLAVSLNPYIFTIAAFLIISMYGGGFSVMPAFVADAFKDPIYENQEKSTVVIIHGRVLLAWGLAGITAPTLLALCDHYNLVFLVFAILFEIGGVLRMKYPV